MQTIKEKTEDLLKEIEQEFEWMFEARHDCSNIICSWEESSSKKDFEKMQAKIEEIKKNLSSISDLTQDFYIWVKGYIAAEGKETEHLLGISRGVTFQEACKNFATGEGSENLEYWNKNFTHFQGCEVFHKNIANS